MRAVLVERDENRAVVRMTPSWLARLFGARESIMELKWHDEGKGVGQRRGWLSLGSRRWLFQLDHHALIESALDFVPVASPPAARALRDGLRVVK